MNLKDESNINVWNEFVWTSSDFVENETLNIEEATDITELFEQEYRFSILDAEIHSDDEIKEKESQCTAMEKCDKNATFFHEETKEISCEIVTSECDQTQLSLEAVDESIYVIVDEEIDLFNSSEVLTCKSLKKYNSDPHLSICHSLHNSEEVPESTSSKVVKANRSLPNILRSSRTRLSLDRMSPAPCDTDDNAYSTSLTLDSSISEEESDRINKKVHRKRKQIHNPFVIQEELVDVSVIDDSIEIIAAHRSIKKRKLCSRSKKCSQRLRNVVGRKRTASISEVIDQRKYDSLLPTSTKNPFQEFDNILDPTLFSTSHQDEMIDLDDVISCLELDSFDKSLCHSQEDLTINFDILSPNNWGKECEVLTTTIDNSANCQNYDINFNDIELLDAEKYKKLEKEELQEYAIIEEEEYGCIKCEEFLEETNESCYLGSESQDYVCLENNDIKYVNMNGYDFPIEYSNEQQDHSDMLEKGTIVIPKKQCQTNGENYPLVSNCENETSVQRETDKTDRIDIFVNSEDHSKLSQMDIEYTELELGYSNSDISCESKNEYSQVEKGASAIKSESKTIEERSQRIEKHKSSLVQHLKNVHQIDIEQRNTKKYNCNMCPKIYKKIDAFIRHLDRHMNH